MRFLTLLILAFIATANTAHADTLRVQVVDAQTGRPIEGAVVSARWITQAGVSSESEAESDAQGWFTLDRPAGPLRDTNGEIMVVYTFGHVVWINSLIVNVQGPPRPGAAPPSEERRQDSRIPAQIALDRFPENGNRPYHLWLLTLFADGDGHKERRPKFVNAIKLEQAAAEKQINELCRSRADCD